MVYTTILVLLAVGLLAIPVARQIAIARRDSTTFNTQVLIMQLLAHIPSVVATVAQVYKNTNPPTDPEAKAAFNAERRQYAVSLIMEYAKVLNLSVDEALLTTISAAIEAEVYKLSSKVDR